MRRDFVRPSSDLRLCPVDQGTVLSSPSTELSAVYSSWYQSWYQRWYALKRRVKLERLERTDSGLVYRRSTSRDTGSGPGGVLNTRYF
jgi:hypothetical protein